MSMIKLIKKFFTIIKNFNLLFFFKINYMIFTKNYSKYPKYVEKFENTLEKKFDFKYCLTFSSGTAAFYASLLSLNLKKKSRILISSITFPSIIEILKKEDFEIYFFDIDKNFNFNFKNIILNNYDLLVITHPFGFYINIENLRKLIGFKTKIIFDSSHSQGIKFKGINHMKFADISFMSLQGNKAISCGEGGAIFTDNEFFYNQMINNHHPGHKKNKKFKIAGAINDLKLRMHPIAALIGNNDFKTFEKRNHNLIKKVRCVYKYLDKYNVEHPFNENSYIGGFHFGIPFFSNHKISSSVIKKYNWYKNLDILEIKPVEKSNHLKFFEEIYFLDLEWIKNERISSIMNKIDEIFKNVS